MDPLTIGLGAKVIDVLMPYVKKGAAQLAKDVGVPAVEKVESLLETLKVRLSGDKEATDTLTHFEEKPERHKEVLKDILEEKIAQDKNLAAELDRLLKEMGPTLDIIQKIKVAEKEVMGLEAEEMAGGKASISQDIEQSKEKVTGAKIKRIG